jgi:hypothetical protein
MFPAAPGMPLLFIFVWKRDYFLVNLWRGAKEVLVHKPSDK